MKPRPSLGVAICTYNAAEVILDCLETVLASTQVRLRIVVVDNASSDRTVAVLREWARTRNWSAPEDCPFTMTRHARHSEIDLVTGAISDSPHRLRLLESSTNGGFAAGVNIALAELEKDSSLDRYWILNPDCLVPSETAMAFATQESPDGGFSLMGGRVLYCDGTDRIQIDGGTLNRRTGVTGNLNLGAFSAVTPAPSSTEMDFVTGASMVASRQFYKLAGPLPEEYFLYYEEVDWAQRRGSLPLLYCKEATIYHRAGTAIGSPTLGRPASAFSLYFKHRARLRFVRQHLPRSLPIALIYSFAKALQLFLNGYFTGAATIISASFGRPPSREIRERLRNSSFKS